MVVIMPTKESVFWPRVQNPDYYPGLRQLIADENRLRLDLTANVGGQRHRLSGRARSAPGSSCAALFEDMDGHPNELGHRIITLAVARHLTQLSSK